METRMARLSHDDLNPAPDVETSWKAVASATLAASADERRRTASKY
jgi:hypothetical protein